MSSLIIRKKSLKTWLHVDSITGSFIISKFYFNANGLIFQIVEQGEAKLFKYNVSNITVIDDVNGGTFTFTNITDLSLKLEELKYPAFYRDGEAIMPALEDLTNVSIDGVTNGQVLAYNTSTSKWENLTVGGLTTPNLQEVLTVGNRPTKTVNLDDGDYTFVSGDETKILFFYGTSNTSVIKFPNQVDGTNPFKEGDELICVNQNEATEYTVGQSFDVSNIGLSGDSGNFKFYSVAHIRLLFADGYGWSFNYEGSMGITPTYIDALKRDGSNANGNINIGGYNLNANELTSANRINGNGYHLINNSAGQVGLYATATDELIAILDTSGDKIYKYANSNLTYNETTNELKWGSSIIATLADIPSLSGYATTSDLTTGLGTKQDTLTASNTHTFVDGLTTMTTPVDADRMTIIDNSVSLAKKITWANIKATLKTYFDGLYTTTSAVATQITTALSGYLTTGVASTTYATKSMGAYSFRVNNTNATADSTETTYKALGKQTLSATGLVFTGTTAPSGTATLTYNYARVGNTVTATFTLLYTTAGSAITAVSIPFPSDMPTPIQPNGFTSASEKLYIGSGQLGVNKTVIGTAGMSAIRNNSANNGFDFVIITTTSTNLTTATGTVIYLTA